MQNTPSKHTRIAQAAIKTIAIAAVILGCCTRVLAQGAMYAAINGRAFDEKALAGALKGALINTGLAQTASTLPSPLDSAHV